ESSISGTSLRRRAERVQGLAIEEGNWYSLGRQSSRHYRRPLSSPSGISRSILAHQIGRSTFHKPVPRGTKLDSLSVRCLSNYLLLSQSGGGRTGRLPGELLARFSRQFLSIFLQETGTR